MQESPSTVKPAPGELELRFEEHRKELTAYCYRMVGSPFEAEDAVQETFIRAWRAYDRFEGRAALRSWLYRIATNVCLDALEGRKRRALPMDLGPAREPIESNLRTLPEVTWIEPIPDGRVVPDGDPADVAVARETIRLAFVAALQHLPPRQRAVLILCEVLRWQATEVAELLETSVASVNSALQRARATLEASELSATETAPSVGEADAELLARYVEAFERYDMDALTSLIREDATQSMPPFDLWLRGRDDILTWWVGPGAGCRGSRVLATTAANGAPAFGQYKPSADRRRVTSRGRCRCSRSRTAGSPGSRSSSTRSGCSRCSGYPLVSALSDPSSFGRRLLIQEDVGQAHESHELSELVRCVAQPNPAASAASGELEAREGVDGHRVRADAAHVDERDRGLARLEERTNSIAEPRQVGGRDRPANREADRLRLTGCHRERDSSRLRNSSGQER